MEYWRTGYDWRACEDRLHRAGQFRTVIDGLGIHFLHRRSARADATPLVLTHGWPGSVIEFLHVMDELADPEDPRTPAFHVVAPSLPGFGFSDKPAATGWDTERIAAAWVELMGRLGYSTFLAHGGDWGGNITTVLGGRFPGRVLGVHSLFAEAPPGMTTDGLTGTERAWTEETRHFWRHRAAYAKQQATRPQTIGYALTDSPVALLAWILDKFAEWSDTQDSPFETISRDRVLDNVTLYWLTRSGASAARIYHESHNSLDPALRVDVPSAITMYPRDIEKTPRRGPGSGTATSSAGARPRPGATSRRWRCRSSSSPTCARAWRRYWTPLAGEQRPSELPVRGGRHLRGHCGTPRPRDLRFSGRLSASATPVTTIAEEYEHALPAAPGIAA